MHRCPRALGFLLALILILTGCGGGASTTAITPTSSSVAGVAATASPATAPSPVAVQVTSSPAEARIGTLTVDFGPAALDRITTVTLTQRDGPPQQPANPNVHAVGSWIDVDVGSAVVQGTITFTASGATDSDQLSIFTQGVFIGLPNATRGADGRTTATLTFTPGDPSFSVGILRKPYPIAPPHEAWGSWNGYVFRPAPRGGLGKFEKVVSLGEVVAPLPDLGMRPVIFVHGLGSNVQTFVSAAQSVWESGTATCIVGFEYDTLDAVQNNGRFLRQALRLFGPTAGWNIVAHSMGTLVTRSSIEQLDPLQAARNKAVLMCGPHLGSIIVDRMQDRNAMGDALNILIDNGYMDFRNADGQICKVANREKGLDDLRADSPFLAALNRNAANNHPGVDYFTMAGRQPRSTAMLAIGLITGIQLADGLVSLESANFSGLGQRDARSYGFDHVTVNIAPPTGDGNISFPEIARYLSL